MTPFNFAKKGFKNQQDSKTISCPHRSKAKVDASHWYLKIFLDFQWVNIYLKVVIPSKQQKTPQTIFSEERAVNV